MGRTRALVCLCGGGGGGVCGCFVGFNYRF